MQYERDQYDLTKTDFVLRQISGIKLGKKVAQETQHTQRIKSTN